MRDKAIAEWKEKKIARAVFEFSCGGDSMNETNLVFKDENDEEVDVSGDLDAHIEGKLWNEVTFYECSDGHYMGEFGEVIIELDEDKTLDFYGISDRTTLQIIHKTRPISISFKGDSLPPRRLSESMPSASIFENYQPSPLDTFDIHKYSKSNSPNIYFLADQSKDIMRQIQTLTDTMETIANRLERLETRVTTIYNSVIIPKK